MTDFAWHAFCRFRDEFKKKTDFWSEIAQELLPLQKNAALADNTPDYPVETPIVYNRSLDDVTASDDIKLIVIGDNPGKDEQRAKNCRYLVGQAGKLADGFFRRNPALGIDFRKNVIILNKTPIHTAKTKQLSYVLKNGSPRIRQIFDESQKWCAESTARLHRDFCAESDSVNNKKTCAVWLVGYGELSEKKLFSVYAKELGARYKPLAENDAAKNSLLVFQHFSMNRFSINLRDFLETCATSEQNAKPLAQSLHELGLLHRKTVLGF